MKLFRLRRAFLPVALALAVVGCVAAKGKLTRSEQQALIRDLDTKCEAKWKPSQKACEQSKEEMKKLYEVYGCHCKDDKPKDHKPIW